MSKIFRLHSGATENIVHWHNVGSHFHDTFIASINDPSGATAHTQITSIPSPFARMDLMRTAFKNIAFKKDLDGSTIYHRMVSDCLDIGEIFFNIEAFTDKVEILEWNPGIINSGGQLTIEPNSDLGRLVYSRNPKHKLLGESMAMYLNQDQKAFNFGDLKNCYLLNYKHGPELINIIGGTSPSTLFFSSANNLSFTDISFANDKVFDDKFCPLHKRGREFIKFIFSLKMAFLDFSQKFPDLNNYLEQTFVVLDNSLKDSIRGLSLNSYESEYKKISVNAAGNHVEILGTYLRTKNYAVVPSSEGNDFIIETSKSVTGLIPCVLPNEPFNESLKYAGGLWQSNYYENVPFFDERALQDRTLPNQKQLKYPYLTVSDLLEPYIIKLPYPIDDSKFFNGNYEIKIGEKDHSYIIPIKKEYFIYFDVQDLYGSVSDGRKRFELQQLASGVKAIIRLPIKNGRYVELSRIYAANQFQDRIQPAQVQLNLGIVVESQINLVVYPFLRVNDTINPHYRVLLVDRDIKSTTRQNQCIVSFFSEANSIKALPVKSPTVRSNKLEVQGVTTAYHIVESNFDFVEVSANSSKGILIPLFKPLPKTAKSFKFAIDFGTTNTHIEYKVGNQESKPFDITENDVQIGTLHYPDESTEVFLKNPKLVFGAIKLVDIIKEEFIPLVIGENSQYKFPQRTVIYDNGSFNLGEASFALADFNIPFWYLKEDYKSNSEITTNLKWGDFRNDNRFRRRTEGFLKQLLLMIRNKVLLSGGELSTTEIIWFYPSSMPKFRRNILEEAWIKYYTRYLPGGNNLNKMSESFAPFYYYYHKFNVRPNVRPAVNIDIGGGTTDVVVYQSSKAILLTSFRFASNSIFGDGYGSTSAFNGFVQRYEKLIKDAIANARVSNLNSIYERLSQTTSNSIELIEFFFSLEENKVIVENKIPLSFSKMLTEDHEFKLIFLFFYSAIIYHISKLMKAKNLDMPDYITFSGNGSKVIKLTDGSHDLSVLSNYTRFIMEDIFSIPNTTSIELRLYKNPKQITCKGGLECSNFTQFNDLENEIKTTLIGTNDSKTIPASSLKYNELNNSQLVDSVCHEVNLFIDTFFNWNTKFNLYQNFGVNPKRFTEYQALLKEKVREDLLSGIYQKLEENQDNTSIDIEETLFFYPLSGAINRLAFAVNKNTNQ